MKPVRVQLSRKKGWRMPENTVSVARPGFWGNPHAVVRDRMRWDGETYDESGEHVLSGPWLCELQPGRLNGFWFSTKAEAVAKAVELYRWKMTQPGFWSNAQRRLPELAGKNLGCWCPLDAPCHADVLLELASAPHTARHGDRGRDDGCLPTLAASLSEAEKRLLLHPRFNPKGWEPADPFTSILTNMVAKSLFRRVDGRCGFERMKDAFVIPTADCLALRAFLEGEGRRG